MNTFDRVAEVEAILAEDETALGSVWRHLQEGLSIKEIADLLEVTPGPVYANDSLIRVLRDGYIPPGPTVATQSAARIRSWLANKTLSPELRTALEEQESLVRSRAEDKSAQAAETKRATEVSEAAERVGTPGIYVYTLPHYLRHPYDPETGRTMLKVGHSAVDAVYRASSQGRFTALPEDPILLRIYPVDASADAEKKFHSWLRDADHPTNRTLRGGSEWFVTSTKFLDRVADALGLEVQVINDLETLEDM